jgi:transcriptional regulator with XRE-family HTH domain
MTREELISSREYWVVDIQTKLYEALEAYRSRHGLNRTQLAAELGFSKGYISQILNGDFDHRISKLVELSLKMGMVPDVQFKPMEQGTAIRSPTAVQIGKPAKAAEQTSQTKKNRVPLHDHGKSVAVRAGR